MGTTRDPKSEVRGQVIEALRQRLAENQVLDSDEHRIAYSFDASGDHQWPAVAVRVTGVEDVIAVTEIAREFQVPIVARGAGSGKTGGAIPAANGIALVFTGMNRILEIDPANLTATCEPGVVLDDLNRALAKHGLWYPPDPASAKIATLGGSVAESSGGLRGVKWGTTRDYILRLRVVTMRGEVLTLGARTHKSVVGYDLVRQIVGSEGTLAIITEIMVRVVPRPQHFETLLATFDDEVRAFEAASAVVAEPVPVGALEAMDAMALEAIRRDQGHPMLESAQGAVLIECDGHPAQVADDIARAESVCRREGAVRLERTADPATRESLWAVRRGISIAARRLKPEKISEDICVPQSRMAEAVRRMRGIETRHGITMFAYGHAGDGNFHVNFLFDPKEEGLQERLNAAVHDVFSLAIELGGTLSGEHGIGSTKRDYLGMEVGKAEMALMRRIKAAWDPDGLLNPGKILPPETL